jgi:hypothetical protein
LIAARCNGGRVSRTFVYWAAELSRLIEAANKVSVRDGAKPELVASKRISAA